MATARRKPRTNTQRIVRHKQLFGNTKAPKVRKGRNRKS